MKPIDLIPQDVLARAVYPGGLDCGPLPAAPSPAEIEQARAVASA